MPARRKTKSSRKRPVKKKAAFTRAVTKVIQKKSPTNEVRDSLDGILVGNPTPSNSFDFLDISSISLGTQINQKLTGKVYVAGIQVSLSMLNNHVAPKMFRFMIVQNKNPSDTLDVSSFTDIYENDSFGKRTPTGSSQDAHAKINRDVVKIICDKRFTVPYYTQGAVQKKFWCPIKKYWTYHSVDSESACTSGKTYIVVQACDFTTTANTDTLIYSMATRLFYKNVDNV